MLVSQQRHDISFPFHMFFFTIIGVIVSLVQHRMLSPSLHMLDSVMKDFSTFGQRYMVMLKRFPNFSNEIRQTIHDYIFRHIMFMLVEGYSRVKKVTTLTSSRLNELLDFTSQNSYLPSFILPCSGQTKDEPQCHLICEFCN